MGAHRGIAQDNVVISGDNAVLQSLTVTDKLAVSGRRVAPRAQRMSAMLGAEVGLT